MNKLFKQIGIGGTIGIACGGLGILVGLLASFGAGLVVGLLSTAFTIGFISIFWFMMFKPMVETNRLMDIGLPAEATIVSIAENGSSMRMGGSIPKAGVNLVLDVRPVSIPAYRTKISMFISMFEISMFKPGSVVKVKYDPKNPMKVAVVEATSTLGSFASSIPDAQTAADEAKRAAFTKELDQLVIDQKRLFKDGEEAKATITATKETGVNVNGDNPLMEVTFEVHTAAGETFSATTKALILRASLPKYGPGKEVVVKFDPKDHTKVTLFHSA